MPKNTLVLTSGGILGVTYGGVFRCMEERGINLDSFTEVYGTSVGALIGLLVVSGMSYLSIRKLLINLPMNRLFQITSEGLIGFADNQGIDKGTGIRKICSHILTRTFRNPDIRFGELGQRTGKHFVVNATNVRNGETVIFGTIETPDIRVEDAILASAAIPFLYAPVRISDMVLVDGGVTNSLLLDLVPKEDLPNTIAVVPLTRLDRLDIQDVPGMAKSVYFTMANTSIKRLIQSCDPLAKDRIIYIRTPVDTTVMLSEEADSSGVRETLDFLGYTEANRSDIIINFGKTAINVNEDTSQASSVITPATPAVITTHSEEEYRAPLDPHDQSNEGQLQVQPFLPHVSEESDMISLPPPDKPADPRRSLPPPIETREAAAPPTTLPVYRPVL